MAKVTTLTYSVRSIDHPDGAHTLSERRNPYQCKRCGHFASEYKTPCVGWRPKEIREEYRQQRLITIDQLRVKLGWPLSDRRRAIA